ncbi:MAG: hypothetical protein ACREQ5_16030, partial [Candidatus Dormibacteria bacterium]
MSPRARAMFTRNKKTLGYKETVDQPHAEMIQWFIDRTKHFSRKIGSREKGVLLVPRGCFKTSDITIGGIIDTLIEDPNKTVLLGSHTQEYSMQILAEIKWHLEHSEA